LLAAYRQHQRSIDGNDYFRLDCTARVHVHFTDPGKSSPQYGTFQRFSAVDGLAYGDDRVIAFMDQKLEQWLFYDSGYHWPVMVVTEVGGPT